MSDQSDEKKPVWPKYLPYTAIAMGMIQPEWMYMSHFFEEEEEETEETAELSTPSSASDKPLDKTPKPAIQIHFRSRP